MQGRGTQCGLLSMQRLCSGATEGRGCHAWSSFHVLILKKEEGYRAHEEAVGEEKRCNRICAFGSTPPVLPFQVLTEFLTFLLLRDYTGWNYWPHHSRVHLSSFNFGFTVWFSQDKAMLAEVQGLLAWPGSLSVITVTACPSLSFQPGSRMKNVEQTWMKPIASTKTNWCAF